MEPVINPVDVDMGPTGPRPLVELGEAVHTIFVSELAVGTTRFELEINGRWIRFQQGDSLDLGDCTPTVLGIRVRSQPALVGLFSHVILGGTPSRLER